MLPILIPRSFVNSSRSIKETDFNSDQTKLKLVEKTVLRPVTSAPILSTISSATEGIQITLGAKKESPVAGKAITKLSTVNNTAKPLSPRYTTILTKARGNNAENVVEHDRPRLLFPSKGTLQNFGFTSGHQNSFGIPIEEDERILRMLNEEMLKSQMNRSADESQFISTTDLNTYRTKVSPTLPILNKFDTTTELSGNKNDGSYL